MPVTKVSPEVSVCPRKTLMMWWMTRPTWSHLFPDSWTTWQTHSIRATIGLSVSMRIDFKLLKNTMSTEQFYKFWEKVALSELIQNVPEDVEQFCAEHEITVDYFIEEFLWWKLQIRSNGYHLRFLWVLHSVWCHGILQGLHRCIMRFTLNKQQCDTSETVSWHLTGLTSVIE